MRDVDGKVLTHCGAGAGYRVLELELGELADEARPGQFVHLRVPGLEPSALRRPFSIYGAKDGVLRILYKTVGRGTAADILARDDFERLGWEIRIATQDGALGESGLVTVPLDRELAAVTAAGGTAELYACGPDGMLRAVGERAIGHGFKGWLSLDKHMVCGVGACLACVQKLRRADGEEWLGRVCVDGPVFESREIVW